ncbi:hypothetical protein ACFQX6_67035 [Streptosporangium lutulentum]
MEDRDEETFAATVHAADRDALIGAADYAHARAVDRAVFPAGPEPKAEGQRWQEIATRIQAALGITPEQRPELLGRPLSDLPRPDPFP